MSEIKLDAEELEEAGAALGVYVRGAFFRGFQAGMDAYDVMQEENRDPRD